MLRYKENSLKYPEKKDEKTPFNELLTCQFL